MEGQPWTTLHQSETTKEYLFARPSCCGGGLARHCRPYSQTHHRLQDHRWDASKLVGRYPRTRLGFQGRSFLCAYTPTKQCNLHFCRQGTRDQCPHHLEAPLSPKLAPPKHCKLPVHAAIYPYRSSCARGSGRAQCQWSDAERSSLEHLRC